MRFVQYLKEELDSEDWGSSGKKFEKVFLKACKLVGLEFEENRYAGRLWDFHPKGSAWIMDNNIEDKEQIEKKIKEVYDNIS